jgi:acyl-CoA synthetase (AMP-forming)/AMP-acid ligase II
MDADSLAGFLSGSPVPPDAPLLHGVDGSSVTRGELTTAAEQLSAALRHCGVTTGDPVACLVGRGPDALVVMFAVWLAGGVYVPLSARLTDAELHAQLAETAPRVVACAREETGRVPDGLSRAWPEPDGRWTVRQGERPWQGTPFAPGDALVLRTSGTTGRPKPVVLTHTGVRGGIDTVLDRLRGRSRRGSGSVGGPMPNLIPVPLALWAGLWNTLFAFRAGAAAILLDRFDTRDFALLVREFGIRSTVLAPAMMTMLTEDPEVADLAPLSYVRSITAPLPPAQARRFHERFGVGVLNCYGQTELGGEVVGWTAADLRAHGRDRIGSVGRPHPGVSVRVLDADGVELPTDVVGEICVHSPFAAQDVTDRLVDGHLRTGDLGRIDPEGFLWVEGRVAELINRGGLKVVPQEVEEALRTFPEVADACVAGVPDPRLGEVPVAWVRAAAGTAAPRPAALRAALRGRLAAYKIPVEIRLVDSFPTSEIGKVLRHRLAAEYRGGP